MGPTETKSHFAEAKWDCADETSWQHTHSILWQVITGRVVHHAQAMGASETGLAQRHETQVQMTK
jgi:hypothetical protein